MKKLVLIVALLLIAMPVFAAEKGADTPVVIGADTPFQQAADALQSSFKVDPSKPVSEQPTGSIFQAASDNMSTWQACESGDKDSPTVMFQKAYDYVPATAPLAKDTTLRDNQAQLLNVRSYKVAGERRRLIKL
ncbi:MAG: hypothetical protein HQ579_02175 [Candidatus Omnitrophica bacterium]|nr:hypothetical protein [Candidatus Omnitrophota bacterium]